MEVIYPRNTRQDSAISGTVGASVPVVDGGVVNNEFNDWLTQYFSEDNSKTIIETINNYAAEMPDIGVNDLIFAYMAKFESELKKINDAIRNADFGNKLIENHTVIDLGEFNWNGNLEHIYMLSGGVPSTITINQYINNICGVALFGSEFQSLDAATGLIDLSLYPTDYLQNLLDSNVILNIGADKYVPITICDITVNDNELGEQIDDVIGTEDNTGVELFNDIFGLLYDHEAVTNAKGLSSGNGWDAPTFAQCTALANYVGGAASPNGKNLQIFGDAYWNTGDGLDTVGFSAVGSGYRATTFKQKLLSCYLWSKDNSGGTFGYGMIITDAGSISVNYANMNQGRSVRLVKDAAGIPDGTIVSYVGNNGLEYEAIAINGLYWLKTNLYETLYKDGTPIPIIEDNALWDADDLGACCRFDNQSIQLVSNGSVAVPSTDGVGILENDSVNGLREFIPLGSLPNRNLSSLLLRRI